MSVDPMEFKPGVILMRRGRNIENRRDLEQIIHGRSLGHSCFTRLKERQSCKNHSEHPCEACEYWNAVLTLARGTVLYITIVFIPGTKKETLKKSDQNNASLFHSDGATEAG